MNNNSPKAGDKRPRVDEKPVPPGAELPEEKKLRVGQSTVAKKEITTSVEEDLRGEENSCRMSMTIEPPSFVSDNKSYETYKQDLKMWSRITTLKKSVQAEMVVYKLDGHPSGIKDKIMTQLGDKLEDNEKGIDILIEFLDGIYTKDDMADAWENYNAFRDYRKKPGQDIASFISDWEQVLTKAKTAGCEYSDVILAFKLLKDSEVTAMEANLIMTAVDFTKGKTAKDLKDQMIAALKKFKGRSIITNEAGEQSKEEVSEKAVLVAEITDVLLSQGWKPPNKSKRRSRSESPNQQGAYKGKKNPLDKNFKQMKCFLCACEHTEKCQCPCVYHLANTCPKKRKRGEEDKTPELGLLIESIYSKGETSEGEDFVLVVKESSEDKGLVSVKDDEAVLDCACPTTVTGVEWMEHFYRNLSAEDRKKVVRKASDKMYRFGEGESRQSEAKITFPCHMAGRNIMLTAEVLRTSFPLLIGNTAMTAAGAVLFIEEEKARIMGNEIPMRKTESGHFSIKITAPVTGMDYVRAGATKKKWNSDSIQELPGEGENAAGQEVHDDGHVPEDEDGREAEVKELPGDGENAAGQEVTPKALATGSSPSAHCTERAGPGCEAMGQEGGQEGQEKVQKLHYGENIQKNDCIFFKNKSESEEDVSHEADVQGEGRGVPFYGRMVAGGDMVAQCLMDVGAPSDKLMEVLRSGQYEIDIMRG